MSMEHTYSYLLLTLIHRYMKPVLEAGYVYIVSATNLRVSKSVVRLKNIFNQAQTKEIRPQEALARYSESFQTNHPTL